MGFFNTKIFLIYGIVHCDLLLATCTFSNIKYQPVLKFYAIIFFPLIIMQNIILCQVSHVVLVLLSVFIFML